MIKQKGYSIPFSGLKQGKHKFDYTIDNTFFESFEYNEFNNAAINVAVELNKMSTMLELEMKANGIVNVNCDVSSEPYDQDISSELELVVKFGDEFNDENEEILIIPYSDHTLNIAQYIYETIVLTVPVKRIHPGIEDGTLQSEILEKFTPAFTPRSSSCEIAVFPKNITPRSSSKIDQF